VQLNEYRLLVPRPEITLERIRLALFSFLGVKEPSQLKVDKDKATDFSKIREAGLPAFSFTTEEKEAWLKAGMPNIGKFLTEFRRKRKKT